MAFVSTEIRNLVKIMVNNPTSYLAKLLPIYTALELRELIAAAKFELANTYMTEEEADMLYALQLTLENALRA
jgi:hypothetical protein